MAATFDGCVSLADMLVVQYAVQEDAVCRTCCITQLHLQKRPCIEPKSRWSSCFLMAPFSFVILQHL